MRFEDFLDPQFLVPQGQRLRRAPLASLLALLAYAFPAAETAKASEPATEHFGDWEVVCTTASECKAVQRLAVKGTDETVFLLTVLPGEKKTPVAVVSVPLGGYLVPGIEFKIDAHKPYKLLIETCTSTGCHAGFPLEGRVDRELRTGQHASFRIWTSKSKPVDVDVSLRGLADALVRLGRSS